MAQTTRFCPHCHRQVAETSDGPCPHCAGSGELWQDMPTVELSDQTAHHDHPDRRSTPQPELRVGTRLAHYEIEQFLGQGGMAQVYLATHTTLRRPCALKLLHHDAVDDQSQAIESFFAEARTVASLVHPQVVTLHNIGSADGRHFIEMEYVRGNSLGHHLQTNGPLSPVQATQLIVNVCDALAAAHEIDLIHRDVKPANILLTHQGTAKLADFGLAKQIQNHTGSGAGATMCGTPNYMAPELFLGQPASKQSDVYSLAVTYFALLTGRLPLQTESIAELAAAHATRRTVNFEPYADSIPQHAQELLLQSLHHAPQERFRDAAEMLVAFRSLFGNLRPLECLVEEALEGVQHELTRQGERFSILMPLSQGRSQTVHVELTTDTETQEHVIRIFSVCGKATPDHYERALLLNADVSHGSLAIQQLGDAPHFVMTNVYPRNTCDPAEVRRSVLDIAKHSDALEHLLADEDEY